MSHRVNVWSLDNWTLPLHRVVRRVALGLAALVGVHAGWAAEAGSAPAAVAAGIPGGFESRFANVNGVRIHYVVGGKGSPMLLIHGWPEDWYAWRKVMPQLAQKHTVVAVDLRGFGKSEITASGYDRKTLAEDLHGLMVSLGHRRATLVGHDWGGPVAYAYAAVYRDAVDRLVVIEGTPNGPWSREQKAPFLKNPFWFFGFFGIPDYAEKVLAGHEGEFLDWFYRDKGFHVVPGGFSEADIAYYENTFAQRGRLGASLQLYRTIDQDIADSAVLSRTPLTIPVLAIGAAHGIGPGVAEAMRHVSKNVTPVLMNDTGHFIPEERPEVLTDLVEAFIAGKRIAPQWSSK